MDLKRIWAILLSMLFVVAVCGCANGKEVKANYDTNQRITIKEPTYNSLDEYKKPDNKTTKADNDSQVLKPEAETPQNDESKVTTEAQTTAEPEATVAPEVIAQPEATAEPNFSEPETVESKVAESNVAQAEEAKSDNSQSEEKVEQNNSEEYTGEYIANKNTKKFHKQTCGSVKRMKAENIYKTADRQELTDAGYIPCARCKP